MSPLERYALIVELRKNGATQQQMADRCGITPRRVAQILAAGPPERSRQRGRPCPNVIDGERCAGSSHVVKVWQEDDLDAAVRLRECIICRHRWYTKEIHR